VAISTSIGRLVSQTESTGSDGAVVRGGSRSGLLVALTAVGIVLRARAWLAERPFWIDEAMLGESIVTRGIFDLLTEPLGHQQSSPPGFLVLVFLAGQPFGFSELSLRAVPFLASIVSLLLAHSISRTAFSTRVGRAVFLGSIAFSPFLTFYGQELKPYAVDVLATLWFLRLWYVSDTERFRLRHGIVAGLLVLSSTPGAVVAGVFLAARLISPKLPHSVRTHLQFTLPILGALGAHATYLNKVFDSKEMRLWWESRNGFPPEMNLIHQFSWLLEKLSEGMYAVFSHGDIGFSALQMDNKLLWTSATVVALIGLAISSRRNPMGLAVVAAVLLLSAARIYPMNSRLSMFVLPALCFGLASTCDGLSPNARWQSRIFSSGAVIGTSYLLLLSLSVSSTRIVEPDRTRNLVSTLDSISTVADSEDVPILNGTTGVIYNFYVAIQRLDTRPTVVIMDTWQGPLQAWTDTDSSLVEKWDEVKEMHSSERLIPARLWVVGVHRQQRLQEATHALVGARPAHLLCEDVRNRTYVALVGEILEPGAATLCKF